MEPDLTDDERTVLIGLLVGVIENDPFPQSPRVQQLRGILTKLRAGLTTVGAGDDAVDPDTREPADIDEAEALSVGADFEAADRTPSAGSVRDQRASRQRRIQG